MHTLGLRESKKAATRTALARAVLRLSTRDGIDQVTIDAVAAEANVSVRTFHNYFGGKEDALLHFVSTLFDTIVERIEARPAEEDLWCSVRTALVEAAMSPEVGEPAEIVELFRLLDTEPGLTARTRDSELGDTVEARIVELFARRGQQPHALYPHLVLHNAITTVRVALEYWVTHRASLATDPTAATDPAGRLELSTVLEAAFDQASAGLAQPVSAVDKLAATSPKEH
ncbi:TetR family transcriptional regulator [Gordonia sp. zg691]|uniref:TetR family transcriptional regulator n=1 Tax=Gordonia jinghuaiqii TaxID=2758710 RepID=A0A7D7QZH3_9ACTN|nr:TetR/AcrR family transcriptional regulator [Gordonia jinghuaiqii]MBD0862080.1 TetR family transcriptional regulator [Gordonia jinghuaiqii]MCR5978694.1 TetR family transcriptional regulator [Gordonia jinghuaiqii]QMT03008.1 TetR family transcriptional regulator [Gordonia jinghuaiqii]